MYPRPENGTEQRHGSFDAMHKVKGFRVRVPHLPSAVFVWLDSLTASLPQHVKFIVQELCESRGGRPGLSVLTSLLVSVDVKHY